jgi:large repetitive protein
MGVFVVTISGCRLNSDLVPPHLVIYTPGRGSSGVSVNQKILMDFDEDITAGQGAIVIKKLADDSVFETIPVPGSGVRFNHGLLIVYPTISFQNLTTYYIEVSHKTIKDQNGNYWTGISGKNEWRFTTE